MANIRRLEQLSGWIEYPLTTALLDPPILKVRLKPMDSLSMVSVDPASPEFSFGRFAVDNALGAVAEWDLTENGTAIPVSDETKALYLRPLLAEPIEGRGLLGLAILEDAQNRDFFLKNS